MMFQRAGQRIGRNRYFAHIRKHGEWRRAVQSYLASIHFADAMLGRVLDALEKGASRRQHDRRALVGPRLAVGGEGALAKVFRLASGHSSAADCSGAEGGVVGLAQRHHAGSEMCRSGESPQSVPYFV